MRPVTGGKLKRRYRLVTRLVICVTLASLVLSAYAARQWAGSRAYSELRGNAVESLSLQIEALTGVMEKYRLIPPLLSKRTDVRNLLQEAGPEQASAMHNLLLGVAAASGAREVVIADTKGSVLASARGLADTATISGSRLPEATMQRRLGRAAIRLNDGSRAYAFASHIIDARSNRNIGLIAVMVPFGTIEANWSLSSNPIFVTDAREFVFLSNQPDWVGRPWQASDAAPGLEPLSFRSGEFARVPERGNAEYVEAERTIPILGWTMHVLVDAAPVMNARRNAAWIAALATILIGMAVLLVVYRQEANWARMRREKAQSMRLERIVRDRTAELSSVNKALRNEVEVRRQTEQQLRDTQDELIHAAKLAVIGQMSATLSHEYNQPLAAIKTYASNGARMIERGKTGALPDVLARIGQMVDRMSALSRTLLAFSRKPGTMLTPVTVDSVVGEALVLVGQKAKKAGVEIETDIAPDAVAQTGRLRLSQVIVNLLGNAIDALCGENEKAAAGARIRIAARHIDDRVVIEIADNGPGIDEAVRHRIFEPFFTTKPVGSGLGLGLSIVDSIVRDLQGSVRVDNRDGEPGSCFVIDLPASGQQAKAAE